MPSECVLDGRGLPDEFLCAACCAILLDPTQKQNPIQDCCEVAHKFSCQPSQAPDVGADRAEQETGSEHAGLGEANCSGQLPFWQEKQSQQSMDWKWQLDQEMEGRREKTEEEYETGL